MNGSRWKQSLDVNSDPLAPSSLVLSWDQPVSVIDCSVRADGCPKWVSTYLDTFMTIMLAL